MTETITLPADLARELTHAGVGQTRQGWTVIFDGHIKNGDWNEIRRLIIRRDGGQHYAGHYGQGLTEQQDNGPWEYDLVAEFTPVVPVERTVTEYVTPQVAQALAEQQDGAR